MSHFFFFFNDTATTEIYTLSLHDALPISVLRRGPSSSSDFSRRAPVSCDGSPGQRWCSTLTTNSTFSARRAGTRRSEEHTSELQSRQYLVCRLLLEKKKNKSHMINYDLTN